VDNDIFTAEPRDGLANVLNRLTSRYEDHVTWPGDAQA
jgi:hypothetical protein